jgi:hypothetical protein
VIVVNENPQIANGRTMSQTDHLQQLRASFGDTGGCRHSDLVW